MQREDFERSLSQQDTKRRRIEGLAGLGFLIVFCALLWLYEVTKEIIIHDGSLFIPEWEEVHYNPYFIPFIVIAMTGAVLSAIFLIMDHIFCGYSTIEKDQHYITVHRSMTRNVVYVDGAEVGRIEGVSHQHVIEYRIPGSAKITVSFGRYHTHISFSDNTPSVDL